MPCICYMHMCATKETHSPLTYLIYAYHKLVVLIYLLHYATPVTHMFMLHTLCNLCFTVFLWTHFNFAHHTMIDRLLSSRYMCPRIYVYTHNLILSFAKCVINNHLFACALHALVRRFGGEPSWPHDKFTPFTYIMHSYVNHDHISHYSPLGIFLNPSCMLVCTSSKTSTGLINPAFLATMV